MRCIYRNLGEGRGLIAPIACLFLPLYSTLSLASEKSALSAAWFVSINADLENWCNYPEEDPLEEHSDEDE